MAELKNDKTPKVSVLMPAWNAGKFIGSAIESILNQTYKDFELVIIDDGSDDNTVEIIKEYAEKDNRIVYSLNEKHLYICRSLNKGLELARGDYIARMDADDWSYPDRLEKQVELLEKNPKVVLVGGFIEVCDFEMNPRNVRKYPLTNREIHNTILKYSTFAHPAVTYKRKEALDCGGYNPSLYDSEDYDFYFRIGKLGEFANLSDVMIRLRTHNKSVSHVRITRQSILTLYIKFKAVVEYHYPLSVSDKVFLMAHAAGSILIPAKLRFKLFNLIRKK